MSLPAASAVYLQIEESSVEAKEVKRTSMSNIVGLSLRLGARAAPNEREYTTRWAWSAPAFLRLDNGTAVRYVSAGAGPPLVLLHTIRTQLDCFEKLAPELEGRYRVYALDLPGHGRSSLQPENCTEPLLRKAVSEFLAKLDLRDVTLVGESIRGVLALTVSVDQPDRVKRMVSLNPYDYGETFDFFGSYTFEPRFVTAAWSTPPSRTGQAGWMLASCIPRSRCRRRSSMAAATGRVRRSASAIAKRSPAPSCSPSTRPGTSRCSKDPPRWPRAT